MKKFKTILVLLTLINVVLFLSKFFLQKESTQSLPSYDNTSYELESSYSRCLVDENVETGKKLNSKPILIIRISAQNCGDCIHSLLEEITKPPLAIDPNLCLIVSTFWSNKDFTIFVNYKLEKKLPIINVNADYFALSLEKDASSPFVFILFPDGTAQQIFIPIKENPGRTQEYLKVIRSKYFS